MHVQPCSIFQMFDNSDKDIDCLARTSHEDIGGEMRGVNSISNNHSHPVVGNCK